MRNINELNINLYDVLIEHGIFQIRTIRSKMVEIITNEISKTDLKGVVNKLIPDVIAKEIEKSCQGTFPLKDVYIRKVCLVAYEMFSRWFWMESISFLIVSGQSTQEA